MRLFIVIQRVTANDPVQAIKVTYFCNLNVCNYKWYIYFQVLMLYHQWCGHSGVGTAVSL